MSERAKGYIAAALIAFGLALLASGLPLLAEPAERPMLADILAWAPERDVWLFLAPSEYAGCLCYRDGTPIRFRQ